MKIQIAENIRNLRKKNGLTQEQLAEALGVTVGAVYKWEASLSVPELKLIMEIADFFEISVDALLGYEQQNGNVKKCIQSISQCVVEKDFEEGVSQAEKALQKYPNSFEVVYASAMLYMLKYSEDKEKESIKKSNQLFEKAISLLYQNTDKSINEATILNHIASNYLAVGQMDKGLEILKNYNFCNINSSLIGYTYAVEQKNPEAATPYLVSSMADIINQVIRTLAGMAFMYAQKRDENCLLAAKWLVNFFDSLKAEDSEISFFDKLKAVLLAQCAVWLVYFGYKENALEYINEAYALAKQFDSSPVYTMEGVKFLDGMKNEGVSFDGLGRTAVEAVENFVFGKNDSYDVQNYVKEQWEKLKKQEQYK